MHSSPTVSVLGQRPHSARHQHADWDAFGQKQTDSGNVHFQQVTLPAELVLERPWFAI